VTWVKGNAAVSGGIDLAVFSVRQAAFRNCC
jgi:hypothetical protein